MLREKVLAAAIDMIAAGTSAPIAMAANATPANQPGKKSSNSCGTTSCGLGAPSRPTGLVPAAIATQPRRASNPSTKEYAGRMAALRRIVLRLPDDSVAVTEWGYMNNAIAEPRPRVAEAHSCPLAGMKTPVGAPVAGFVAAILSEAAPKIAPHPPTCEGR